MACPFVCLLFTHVTASKTHCSTPALLGSRAICISASGVESLLHQNVMCPRIMQQVVRHKASSRTPPSPLFPTRLEHPESGMQNVVLWHVHLCACVSHVTASQTHSSARGSRGFCVRASCGDPSCSRPGRQTHQRLPRTNLHHPSSLPCFSILSLACKM